MKLYTLSILALVLLFSSCKTQNSASCKCRYQSSRVISKLTFGDITYSPYISTPSQDEILPTNIPSSHILDLKEYAFASLSEPLSLEVIDKAFDYKGVRYRRGGTSLKGMDCSGLIFTCFSAFGISLPRTSFDMSQSVSDIPKTEAKAGDLIFFKTNSRKGRINHVGLVTEANGGEIKFIHSSIKKGVIVSSTSESYYARAFAKVGRVIS